MPTAAQRVPVPFLAQLFRDDALQTQAQREARITSIFATLKAEFAKGKIRFDPALEDVHTHVERRLGEIAGKDAGYLHAGRSRNDQVALDKRLFIVGACDRVDAALVGLMRALLSQATAHQRTASPWRISGQKARMPKTPAKTRPKLRFEPSSTFRLDLRVS